MIFNLLVQRKTEKCRAVFYISMWTNELCQKVYWKSNFDFIIQKQYCLTIEGFSISSNKTILNEQTEGDHAVMFSFYWMDIIYI